MQQLALLLDGKQDAAVDAAFEKMNTVRGKMPLDEKGAPQERFMREALAPFTEKQAEVFDSLAEALASSGQVAHAESFADLEEFLLPERRGISKAIVRAARGELEPATADMVKLTEDTERSPIARLLAVDGLIHIKAHGQAAAAARTLLASAEQGGDLHLALDLVPRLEHIYKAQNDRESLLELMGIAERLEAAHDKIHPGHRRHRHGR